MRYPSCYVLVTDMDDAKSSNPGITSLSINSKNPVISGIERHSSCNIILNM